MAKVSEDGFHIICDYPVGCKNQIPNTLLGRIEAEEWLFLKSGTVRCPEHIPPWVRPWQVKPLFD